MWSITPIARLIINELISRVCQAWLRWFLEEKNIFLEFVLGKEKRNLSRLILKNLLKHKSDHTSDKSPGKTEEINLYLLYIFFKYKAKLSLKSQRYHLCSPCRCNIKTKEFNWQNYGRKCESERIIEQPLHINNQPRLQRRVGFMKPKHM